MSLTVAQIQALKSAIAADPALSSQPPGPDGSFAIAQALNLPASPTVMLWRTDARVADIADAINWALYTPADAPDNTAAFTNRLLAIQTKQMNLQLMLEGRETLNANKANIRAGLRDAVTAVPSGASGAATSPGGASGATVLAACTRPALRVEAVLAGADATTGATTAKLIGYEGTVNYTDIEQVRTA